MSEPGKRQAVILAGGLGKRLRPLTEAIPKPLLPIGEKSILEIQIRHLAKHGIRDIYIATYYKADYVRSFSTAFERLGVSLTVSEEKKPLGTCGPLSLLRDRLTESFIVVNGDILSNIDFSALYDFGSSQISDITVVTKRILTPFNFGTVATRNDFLVDIQEKPKLELEILAGIYFMKPGILKHIPDETYFGIDHLLKKLLKESVHVSRYLMKDFWLDIGNLESYNEAQQAYEKHFKEE